MSKSSTHQSILILINVRWWNATAFYAVNIARLLQKNGHKVFIGCNPEYPAFSMAKAYGLPVVPMNFYGFKPIVLLKSLIRMVRLIREENITIVNSHRSEDHTFALIAKRLTGIKCIITRGDQRRISSGLFSAWRYRHCDAVIVTCQSIINQNLHIFNPIRHKTSVIYGSVDEDHFRTSRPKTETRKKYGMNDNMKIIGLVGRLSWVKDPFTVIKAAQHVLKKHRDALFLIAGKAVEFSIADLRKAAKSLGIDKHFLFIPQIDDIADVMNTFDIALIISTSSETISRVLLEYMYLGKPIIGSDINAIGEIISPETTGTLIEPGNHQALADNILTLLKNNDMRVSWGKNSGRLYKKSFSEKIFYSEYLKVFERIA